MPVKRVSIVKSPAVREGHAILKIVNGIPILIARYNGSVRAYLGVCPHKYYALCSHELEDGRIVCPGHRERFDFKTGSPLKGIAPKPLFKLKAVEEDGKIYIEADFDELASLVKAETSK